MIVNVHKFLIYGAKEEMDRFFSLAQRAGFLEFIGIWHKKALELPHNVKQMLSAIKILRLWEGGKSGLEESIPMHPELFADKVVTLNTSLERLFEEERILRAEIARIAPFGSFSKEELRAVEQEGKRVFQFFCMKSELAHGITQPPEVVYVGTEYDLDYYVAINRERMQYPKMIEIQIERPVGELKERLADVHEQIHLFEARLRSWSSHIAFLQEGLADGLNDHHLESAKHDASYPMGRTLFAIEAWVPQTRLKGLQGLLSGLTISSEEISIEPMDRVPTCMENKGIGRVGEDLVQVYDTPAISDKDPSTWITVFFSIFFAMIISDAGYGLLYLLLGLFLKWKFPHLAGAGKRFVKLVLILATTTILWGVFTASFFGIEIGPENPYRKLAPLHYLAVRKAEYVMQTKDDVYQDIVKQFPAAATATDGHDFLVKASMEREGKIQYTVLQTFYDNMLMEFALLIGVIHLSFGFCRYLFRNGSGLGWVIFMVGGYLYFPPAVLDATSILNFMGWVPKDIAALLGKQMLYGGFGLAILVAGIQKGFMSGLMEILNVIQVFSDVLSYLRLYALGLAGMIVASTFNELGSNFGFLIGVFIILAGHAVNLALSVMSGVIHGLRLNFLEWYHYCFDGGGKSFNPLKLIKHF